MDFYAFSTIVNILIFHILNLNDPKKNRTIGDYRTTNALIKKKANNSVN